MRRSTNHFSCYNSARLHNQQNKLVKITKKLTEKYNI